MAIIPKFFFDAVVAIGTKDTDDIKWIGTGFLVGRKASNDDSYTLYLITNYHIVENKSDIYVRFNHQDREHCTDYNIPLKNSTSVLFSKHNTADIIAIQVPTLLLNLNKSEYSWFSLDKHALDLNQMKNTDVAEGNLVYSLGFPINMIGKNKNSPICRLGCISRITDLFDDPSIEEYLIDLQAIPGNSGSPVINRPDKLYIQGTSHNESANLIGIISGTIEYSEKCMSNSCDKEHEKNSGFAIVHPVDAIKEVVEQEYIRRRNIY